jgi:sugar phosphate permease
MIEDASLGLDMTSVGGLTSMLPVAYGFSKFLSGVLGARTSPTILLSGAASSLGSCIDILHCPVWTSLLSGIPMFRAITLSAVVLTMAGLWMGRWSCRYRFR